MRVEHLQMVKSMLVGFCSIVGGCYSSCWVWDLTILPQIQESKKRTQGHSNISSFSFVFSVNQENQQER